jgi:hypothetical protein
LEAWGGQKDLATACTDANDGKGREAANFLQPNSPAGWLDHEHAVERDARLERLQWLQEQWPPAEQGFLLFGGWLSNQLLEESRYCFVHGQYIAAAVLAYSLIERIVVAELYASGRDDMERATSQVLLMEAREAKMISSEEFDLLERLRGIRNPLVHFRKPLSSGTFEERWLAGGSAPDQQVERDSREVLVALFRQLARHAT